MLIAVTITSILILTTLGWWANRFLPFRVCPICAGVSGTWIWLVIGHFSGYQIDLVIPALLMGGTVVGVMYKLEQFIKPKIVLIWKTLFVASGFLVADCLITGRWLLFGGGIIATVIITLVYQTPRGGIGTPNPQKVEELKKKMKNCC